MASASLESAPRGGTGDLLAACVAGHGTASHVWARGVLAEGPAASRDLADAVHFLTALHGRQPGMVDHAWARTAAPAGRAWLTEAAEAMAIERTLLTRLAVAAGPIPSTPGGGSESAILAQHAALATLAQSDRKGCALGAALAFATDWIAIRTVLDAAGRRFGVELPPSRLGSREALTAVADDSADCERALLFGAEQLSLQHRGLWDLLEARAQARADA